MVSLNTQHGRSGGGISFEDRSFNAADEAGHENTPLIDTLEQPYRPIKTTGFIILHIVLTIIFMVSIILVPWYSGGGYKALCDETTSKIDQDSGYQIGLYTHAGAFLVSLAFDRLYHHYQDVSRRNGYLEFYRQTRNLRRAPLFIISLGNAILVALIEVFEHNIDKVGHVFCHPWYYLLTLTSIEVIIILIVLYQYLMRTIKFNKTRAPPDATQDDILATFVPTETSVNEIGYRDETYNENVLEKQADLIRYLRERNEHLSRLVLQCKQANAFHRDIPNNNL